MGPFVSWSCQENRLSTNGTVHPREASDHESEPAVAWQRFNALGYGSGSEWVINNPSGPGWRWSSCSHTPCCVAEESDDEADSSMERGVQQHACTHHCLLAMRDPLSTRSPNRPPLRTLRCRFVNSRVFSCIINPLTTLQMLGFAVNLITDVRFRS